jgi:ATP-binding cassette subfamily F protein 3
MVLDRLNWVIKRGKRIGLIGPNGAGKSTLLRIVTGGQLPDDGTVTTAGDVTLGYLAQDVQEAVWDRSVADEAMSAFENAVHLQAEETRLTRALEAEADHQGERYSRLLHDLQSVHDRMVAEEVHTIRPRTEAVLAGLGFEADDMDRPLNTFSGGWRMRVALARMLLQQPDYLLLDEPTNHLDIESIDWLEGYLKSYPGTVVIVSHDRYFLDRMVTSVAEVANGKIEEYAGNYTYYLEEREERRSLQRSAYVNQQKQITDTERFVERFRYKATKARQVQSRVKMLDRLERLPPPPDDEAPIRIRFPVPRRSGREVLRLSRFSKAYETPEGAIEVFQEAGPLAVERGDKIALIGKNGAGKSTLARMLNGNEPFDGSRELGYQVSMTFFAQHQADTLDPALTILDSLRQVAYGQSETELRSMLGAFLFTGEDVFKPVRVLSGGEKSRVALARTLVHPANFLILDEPTNHLDIRSINVLIEALNQYAGSFVVVSHDRHFLDQVCNTVWHVGGGGVREYAGTYSDYHWYLDHGTGRPVQDDGGTAPRLPRDMAEQAADPSVLETVQGRRSGPKTKEQKRREAEERNRLHREARDRGRQTVDELSPRQLRALYEATEKTILQKEERKAELEAELADPVVYSDPEKSRGATALYEALQSELAVLYEEWERIAGQIAEST